MNLNRPKFVGSLRVTRAIVAFVLLVTAAHAGATNTQPNILFIVADDIGVDLLSTYTDARVPVEYPPGYTAAATPNIDTLAANGVTFDNAWATPSCSPTRGTYMTGQYGLKNGIAWPLGRFTAPGTISQLDVTSPYLLPRILKDHGYATLHTGKWHLTSNPADGSGLDDSAQAGFDRFRGTIGGGVFNFYSWPLLSSDVDPITGDVVVSQEIATSYVTTFDVDNQIAWIEEQAGSGKPWFVHAAFHAPHLPIFQRGHYPPAELLPMNRTDGIGTDDCNGTGNLPQTASDELARACYEAAMEALDAEVGRLLAALDEMGELDNTYVVFLGDNGTDNPVVLDPVAVEHSKNSLYLQGIHAPLIIQGPKTAKFSRRDSGMVNTVDLYATFLKLAGIQVRSIVPPRVPIDSESFADMLISDETSDRQFNISQLCVPFSHPAWSLNPAFFQFAPTDGATISDDEYKLIVRLWLDDAGFPVLDGNGNEQTIRELYNIENDPLELVNLYDGDLTNREQNRLSKLERELEKTTGGRTCSDWREDLFGSGS